MPGLTGIKSRAGNLPWISGFLYTNPMRSGKLLILYSRRLNELREEEKALHLGCVWQAMPTY